MNADPKVMEYFVKPLTVKESSAFFLRIRNELADFGYGAYAVERKTDGKFLGFTGLHRIPFKADFTPGIEIAWRLIREAWGNGYATEAAPPAWNMRTNDSVSGKYTLSRPSRTAGRSESCRRQVCNGSEYSTIRCSMPGIRYENMCCIK